MTTYNQTLPNIEKAINKTWHLLQINPDIKQTFAEKPFIGYRKNKNLRSILGQTTIINNKVKRNNNETRQGKFSQCLSSINNLCCKQVISTSKFISTITKKWYDIYHNTNCKSRFIIYLMECRKCNIQYVGKTTTPFNVRLNNHRTDAKRPTTDTAPCDLHFSDHQHDFNRDATFIIIEQVRDTLKSKEEKDTILLKRENGLNQELNNI